MLEASTTFKIQVACSRAIELIHAVLLVVRTEKVKIEDLSSFILIGGLVPTRKSRVHAYCIILEKKSHTSERHRIELRQWLAKIRGLEGHCCNLQHSSMLIPALAFVPRISFLVGQESSTIHLEIIVPMCMTGAPSHNLRRLHQPSQISRKARVHVATNVLWCRCSNHAGCMVC